MALALQHEPGKLEAGLDEAGRGCLAGPVVAAAVILPPDFHHPLLNDSKQLSEKKRLLLKDIIEEEALAWNVGIISAPRIDEINILNASFEAMHQAVDCLKIRPESLLIDGNRFHAYPDIPHICMIKGDGRFMNIAAASILAKTYRDELMYILAEEYPQYGWTSNKGYPTKKHKFAIVDHGLTSYHRLTFRHDPTPKTK